MEFVLVPKGKSWLGGDDGKEGDREVEITSDFYLGKYEVTQEEWEKVRGNNPSHFARKGSYDGPKKVEDVPDADLKRFPVDNITWDDAQLFLKQLNLLDATPGWTYRLPTEVEWEYACRGGPMAGKGESAFNFYLDRPTNQLVPDQANFKRDQEPKPTRPCKVGSYKPNRLGLHDMHGNVWEWCEDAVAYPDGAPARVLRGNCFGNPGPDCRATARRLEGASRHSLDCICYGLRVARFPTDKQLAKLPPSDDRDRIPLLRLPALWPQGLAGFFSPGACFLSAP
jgi:formylglycine-generating enzyme required for sulfatase activity